jgi:integrase/recombinase XerC
MDKQIARFLDSLYDVSPKTVFAYRNALQQFVKVAGENPVLNLETYKIFLDTLRNKSSSTQRVYTTAVRKFYSFSRAGDLNELQEATRQARPKSKKRSVQFNREAVEKVITHCDLLRADKASSPGIQLAALRDRAFVLTLVDTGLRISEACALAYNDVDWSGQRAILRKGDKQAVVRFSNRAIQALNEYLAARSFLDASLHSVPAFQPLFARHDIRASKRIRPITPGGMWKAIKERIIETGLDTSMVRIHDFRHYFISMTYRVSGDLKLSQTLARHASISMTSRYIYLDGDVDTAYDEIFNKKKVLEKEEDN